MIPAETQYKVYNQELLIIIKTFKHWRYYLKKALHSIKILINYNNLYGFINIK